MYDQKVLSIPSLLSDFLIYCKMVLNIIEYSSVNVEMLFSFILGI